MHAWWWWSWNFILLWYYLFWWVNTATQWQHHAHQVSSYTSLKKNYLILTIIIIVTHFGHIIEQSASNSKTGRGGHLPESDDNTPTCINVSNWINHCNPMRVTCTMGIYLPRQTLIQVPDYVILLAIDSTILIPIYLYYRSSSKSILQHMSVQTYGERHPSGFW